MKTYTKDPCPPELVPWSGSGRDWGDFTADAVSYLPVRTALMSEQQHVCCYCESRLRVDDAHIEHFQPRHGPQGDARRTFDYDNLGCSCNGGLDNGNRHCGHYKGHAYDAANFVNPSLEGSARLFVYTLNGGVGESNGLTPQEHTRVQYMIGLLHLDCPRLTNMRRSHAHGLQDAIQGLLDADAEAQIDDLALEYLAPDGDGKLQPFFSLSCQMFSKRAKDVLKMFGK